MNKQHANYVHSVTALSPKDVAGVNTVMGNTGPFETRAKTGKQIPPVRSEMPCKRRGARHPLPDWLWAEQRYGSTVHARQSDCCGLPPCHAAVQQGGLAVGTQNSMERGVGADPERFVHVDVQDAQYDADHDHLHKLEDEGRLRPPALLPVPTALSSHRKLIAWNEASCSPWHTLQTPKVRCNVWASRTQPGDSPPGGPLRGPRPVSQQRMDG